MNYHELEKLIPHSEMTRYWSNRENFALDKDTYPCWVLFVIENGSFEYGFGDEEGIVSKGDLLLCSPGICLRRKVIEPLSFFVFNFNWLMRLNENNNVAKKEVANLAEPTNVNLPEDYILAMIPTGKLGIHDLQRLHSTLAYLKLFNKYHDPLNKHRNNILLQDIWQLYCWEIETMETTTEKRQDRLMESAVHTIREKAYEAFSMKQLSTKLHLNAVQFTRRFKAHTGTKPTEFLTSLRLEKARNLLAKTHLTMDEIAIQCGYDNGLYLSRVFYKKMNIRPSQYRRDHHI